MANKVDLPNPEVDLKQVKEYAETHNMLYTETSAQTGQGVQHAFQTLIQEIQNKVSIRPMGSVQCIMCCSLYPFRDNKKLARMHVALFRQQVV